uniref:Uncharacterized protein n=1 Tax=Timema cristinae TaxID=61476 RepID=A0A7R9D0K5_TIMCR|nr:unnamed protein product [Timema cristinae]
MLTVVTSKVCSILLLADHMFFRHVAARNVRTATNLMLDMLHEADAIFRNSDFNGDGLPDNIGFKARYIIILTSSKSSMNHLQGVWIALNITTRNGLLLLRVFCP